MQLNEVSFAIAVASFFGAILGAALSNWVSARNAAQDRKEARRRERLERLIGLQDSLIRVRARLQYLQAYTAGQEFQHREDAYGEAYGVMLSTADAEIVKVAEQVMLGTAWDGDKNLKLDAIDTGLRRLGDLIDKAMSE